MRLSIGPDITDTKYNFTISDPVIKQDKGSVYDASGDRYLSFSTDGDEKLPVYSDYKICINGENSSFNNKEKDFYSVEIRQGPSISSFQSVELTGRSASIYIQPYILPTCESKESIAIADMQCWLFRNAQKKWGRTAEECSKIFKDNDIFDFVSNCYDLLHVSSYSCALEDVERILQAKGVQYDYIS